MLLFDFAMLFEELVKQHRVHRVVADGVRLALVIARECSSRPCAKSNGAPRLFFARNRAGQHTIGFEISSRTPPRSSRRIKVQGIDFPGGPRLGFCGPRDWAGPTRTIELAAWPVNRNRHGQRVVDSSSRNAVSFSSACTMKRFPSPRCASAIRCENLRAY